MSDAPSIRIARLGSSALGTHHLAFLRAIVQGISVEQAADRYLFGDAKRTRTYLRTLLRRLHGDLLQAAELAGKPHLGAALPLTQLARQAQAADAHGSSSKPRLPTGALTFEEYCENQPDGFFTQSELEHDYQQYLLDLGGQPAGKTSPSGHWDVDRALRAIDVLAPLLAMAPQAEHPIAAWMHAAMAQRFEKVGLQTVGDVIAFINRHGYRWHSRIRGLGRQRAAAMARWINDSASNAGALTVVATQPRSRLTKEALLAVREGRGQVLPFEAIVLPPELDGLSGGNRERVRICQVTAAGDCAAIGHWLCASSNNVNTRRAYGREAERALQWCVYEKGKPLSSMGVEDCVEFRAFLAALVNPTAQWPWHTRRDDWIGAKSHPRSSPNWRPFEGRMSQQSIERSLTIVRAMFGWLVQQAYLASNPWEALRQRAAHETLARPSRIDQVRASALVEEQWHRLLAWADGLEGSERRARARVLLRLAGQAGLKRGELAMVSTDDVQPADLVDGSRRYFLKLRGTVGSERNIPLTQEMMRCVHEYLGQRGLPAHPGDCAVGTPLIAALKSKDARDEARLTVGRIYMIIKRLIEGCASSLEREGKMHQALSMRKLARANVLRHTFGTKAAEKYSPSMVQAWMGHSNVNTTLKYFSPSQPLEFVPLDETFRSPANRE